MIAQFRGGPNDGQELECEQINAVATILPMFTESGSRSFVFMLPVDECERILRGELTKEQAIGPLHTYERVFLPTGGVEFREASKAFGEAETESREPLSDEAKIQKKLFGQTADQFIEKIRAVEISAATDVSILYQYVDQHGTPLNSVPHSITPRTKVTFAGDPEGGRKAASEVHLQTLIDNVNSLVRNAPTGLLQLQSGLVVKIVGFELLIE